jgi:hypothetical protein
MTADEVRLNNFSMAAGRIGAAAILVPLLWTLASLLIFSEGPSRPVAFGVFLLVLAVLLAWLTIRTPFWIALRADRLGNISRNTWITEAIAEKLARETSANDHRGEGMVANG